MRAVVGGSLIEWLTVNILQILLSSVLSTLTDFKLIISVIIGFTTLLFKFNAHIALVSTSSFATLVVIGFAVLDSYEEFINVR